MSDTEDQKIIESPEADEALVPISDDVESKLDEIDEPEVTPEGEEVKEKPNEPKRTTSNYI